MGTFICLLYNLVESALWGVAYFGAVRNIFDAEDALCFLNCLRTSVQYSFIDYCFIGFIGNIVLVDHILVIKKCDQVTFGLQFLLANFFGPRSFAAPFWGKSLFAPRNKVLDVRFIVSNDGTEELRIISSTSSNHSLQISTHVYIWLSQGPGWELYECVIAKCWVWHSVFRLSLKYLCLWWLIPYSHLLPFEHFLSLTFLS